MKEKEIEKEYKKSRIIYNTKLRKFNTSPYILTEIESKVLFAISNKETTKYADIIRYIGKYKNTTGLFYKIQNAIKQIQRKEPLIKIKSIGQESVQLITDISFI